MAEGITPSNNTIVNRCHVLVEREMVTSKFSILPNSKPTILPTYKSYLCIPKYLYLVSRQATETSVVQTPRYVTSHSILLEAPPSRLCRSVRIIKLTRVFSHPLTQLDG